MTIWETIANEALENLGDRARDILSERRANGNDDSAEEALADLADELREDFPDLEDDYGEEAGA